MGNSINNQRIQFHDNAISKHNIPYFNIMLSWLNDLLDSQAKLLEAKGIGLVTPIFGMFTYILAWFIDIHIFTDTVDLIKNIILSSIGISMGVMGAVNTYIAMRQRIKKYKDEVNKEKENNKNKKNIA